MNVYEESPDGAPTVSHLRLRGTTAVLLIGLAFSVVLNVLLAHRVRRLTDAQTARTADRLLGVGATVSPIIARLLNGQQETISYRDNAQSTVLYVFTPPCTWCERNLDNFKSLVEKASGQYRFIGVSLSEGGLAQYVTKNDLKLPVYSGLSHESLNTYKLGSTPQTIVISPEGRVVKDWAGAYVGDQKSQIEAFFHVTLPGLRELPKAEAAKN